MTAKDYRTVLVNVSIQIQQHMGAKRFSLWLCDDHLKPIREVPSSDDHNFDDYEMAINVAESKQIYEMETPEAHLVAVPLIFKEQIRGVIVLSSPVSEDKFHKDKVDFLKDLIIHLAAMAEIYQLDKRVNLIREIHHRVKNNLQIISSLLNLQIRRLHDEASKGALQSAIGRIMSIAAVHEALCEKNIGQVDVVALAHTISSLAIRGMAETGQKTKVEVEGTSSLMLSPRQAANLAAVLNELLSNAIKHSGKKFGKGKIHISLTQEERNVILSVCDNGKGLPDGFDLKQHGGLGLQLITMVAENELRGKFFLENREKGLEAKLIFPCDHQSAQ